MNSMVCRLLRKLKLLVAPLLFTACTSYSGFELPPIISDGMILQQNSNITFWGKAMPGTRISLQTDWDMSVSTTAKLDSTWELSFVSQKADNKNHQLVFNLSDTTVVIDNVLIGEVWLAAGESNMEIPMEGWGSDTIAGAKELINTSEDDLLRYFNVERRIRFSEEGDVRGRWVSANKTTTPTMSALAYMYARQLRDSLNIPVGIVLSACSGTPIEAWMNSKTLKEDPDFDSKINNFDAISKEQEQYKEWLNLLPTVDVQVNHNTNTDPLELITIDDEFMVLSYENFDSWDTINLPQYWESLPIFGEFDGVVWFVKEVQIPRSWLGKKLKLDLGPIDDRDVTFVNSICVGRHDKDSEYSIHRSYDVPAQYIKKTTIKIAVRVTDTHGYGGFAGNKFDMKLSTPDGDKISLAGKWKYKVTAELMDGYLHLFNMQNNQFATRPKPTTSLNQMFPTSLYNGMIEPIKRISFAGMVWYQGVSNVEREDHLQYERLLKKFLPCMRETFNKPNMPIYVIQIAPWEYTGNDKLPGGLLRIAQYKATKDEPNTTLIPSIDLGSMTTAHPSKKWTLANRLTRSVLCNQYGFKHIDQVPVIKQAKTIGSLMTITFDNANQLFNDPNKPNLFEIADETMDFFSANVVVNGNEITVFSHLVSEPVVVRYASKNYVEPTLYNEIGLPAPSFEIYIPRTQQW